MKKHKEPKKEYDCISYSACCVHFCNDALLSIGRSGVGLFIGNDDVNLLPKKLAVIYPVLDTHDAWLRGGALVANGVAHRLRGSLLNL